MNSAFSSTYSYQLEKGHAVSSAYLIILHRYLASLQAGEACTPKHTLRTPIDRDPGYLVPISDLNRLLKIIESLCGHSGFGLDIGQQMHPSDYGLFAYAMMNCDSLMSALKTAATHKTILNQKLKADFYATDELITYQLHMDAPSKALQILIELDFSTAYEFAKKLAGPVHGKSVKLQAVYFSHTPLGPIHNYKKCFDCPVFFNTSCNKMIVKKDVMLLPVYGANRKVLEAIEEKITDISRHKKHIAPSFKEEVFSYVRHNMRWELPHAREAAKAFNMSLSTFKKRLGENETCYQMICDEVRYHHCLKMMQKDSASIKEIAYELGFSNASAFNRAFKRWTGNSPSEFIKQKLNNPSFSPG